MDNNQLVKLVDELKISKDQILREEAEMLFLNEFANDKLSSTALRLAYDCPRFSEDIDLIVIRATKFNDFKTFIDKIVQKNTNWSLKDIKDKRNTMFALFAIREEKLKHDFSLKIEIHKPAKKVNLKMELSLIKSPASVFQPLLLVPTLEELKRMIERKHVMFLICGSFHKLFELIWSFRKKCQNIQRKNLKMNLKSFCQKNIIRS